MTIHLSGKSVNPHWNIPRSLEMLQGLQRAGMLLIEELDKHIGQRDSARAQHPDMMGNATASILVTSYTVGDSDQSAACPNKAEREASEWSRSDCLLVHCVRIHR